MPRGCYDRTKTKPRGPYRKRDNPPHPKNVTQIVAMYVWIPQYKVGRYVATIIGDYDTIMGRVKEYQAVGRTVNFGYDSRLSHLTLPDHYVYDIDSPALDIDKLESTITEVID